MTAKQTESGASAERMAFDRLARERGHEIKVHCYRIMGSLADAEDLTQEVFARAWRSRAELVEPAAVRSWLYRIATNVCLDALRRRKRERRLWSDPAPMDTGSYAELGSPDLDVAWLEPMPDAALFNIADERPSPHAHYEQAEAVRLAFLACIQLLPARQRAIFLLREVLGWSAEEVASAFTMTPQAANSLLQRARRTFSAAYAREPEWVAASDLDRQVAARFAAALANHDLGAFVSLLREDATMHMPPWRAWLSGRDAIELFMGHALRRFRGFRTYVFRANGRCAVAVYAQVVDGDAWQPQSLQVLEIREGAIASIVAFVGPLAPSLFSDAGLLMQPPDPAIH